MAEPVGVAVVAALTSLGLTSLAVGKMFYKVCKPSQMLVRTGLGIEKMVISNSGFVWPFQEYIYLSKEPITYEFNLKAMTQEKIEFRLPMVFSLSPILPEDDMEATIRYARYFGDPTDRDTLQTTILGIIEGETRGIAAEMTVEELFLKRDFFKERLTQHVGKDLRELGLQIINANIKELSDYDSSDKYFTYRKQRAIETANYQAKIDVAEAQKMGEIGVRELQTATRIAISE